MHTQGGGRQARGLAGESPRKWGGAAGGWEGEESGGHVSSAALCPGVGGQFEPGSPTPTGLAVAPPQHPQPGQFGPWPGPWLRGQAGHRSPAVGHASRVQLWPQGRVGRPAPSLVSVGGWGAPCPDKGGVSVDPSARQGAGVRPTALPLTEPHRRWVLQAGTGSLGVGGTSGGAWGTGEPGGAGGVWRWEQGAGGVSLSVRG